MITFTITDRPNPKVEVFGDIQVLSRSGLSSSESILLHHLNEFRSSTQKVLICENRSGILGKALLEGKCPPRIHQHSFDDYYHQRLKERWGEGGVAYCLGEDLPEGESYDEITIQMSQSLSAEFLADLLQQAYHALAKDGRIWLALEPRHTGIIKDIRSRYGALSEIAHPKGKLIRIKKKSPLKKQKKYLASVNCPLKGCEPLKIVTRPGIFSHRRIDGGAMALIQRIELNGKERVLEMGCGSGVVSLALKRRFPEIAIHALDSHARAVAQTRKNALENKISLAGLQLTSAGWKGEGSFDVVIGNPPYFGDHQLSAFFIDEGRRLLTKGGVLWLVAKSMDWNKEYAEDGFDLKDDLQHGDYKVVRWVRR